MFKQYIYFGMSNGNGFTFLAVKENKDKYVQEFKRNSRRFRKK